MTLLTAIQTWINRQQSCWIQLVTTLARVDLWVWPYLQSLKAFCKIIYIFLSWHVFAPLLIKFAQLVWCSLMVWEVSCEPDSWWCCIIAHIKNKNKKQKHKQNKSVDKELTATCLVILVQNFVNWCWFQWLIVGWSGFVLMLIERAVSLNDYNSELQWFEAMWITKVK